MYCIKTFIDQICLSHISTKKKLICTLPRKHQSESVCKTESFDSFFVRETRRGLKCVTLVHDVSSHGQKNESNDSVLPGNFTY